MFLLVQNEAFLTFYPQTLKVKRKLKKEPGLKHFLKIMKIGAESLYIIQ